MLNINNEILDYPEKSFNFFKDNLRDLTKEQRLDLYKIIIKSEYLAFETTFLNLNKSEQNLLINRIISKQWYLLARITKDKQKLDGEQIDKIESLFVLGKILDEDMEENCKYEIKRKI